MTEERNKVLVVDDERYNINVLNDLLKEDYTIMAAKSGEQALKAAEKGKPDLILLDVMMPEMDGYEVCHKLKESPETKDIPVIFITALDDVSDETKGFECGAVDFICKPFHNAVVFARIRMHLELVNAQRKLKKQNVQLKEAMKVREDMESLMRHDLKGPLTPIIGLSQFLIEYDGDVEEQREQLAIIRDSGYRILNMINISTDMVKMENGTYELAPEPILLKNVLQNVYDELKNQLASKKIRYLNELANSSITVLSEELLIHSMFSNLVKNALEASPDGKDILITAKCDQKFVEVSLENFGEVAEKIRSKFFEKYVTCEKANGTGLGTYSAKLIANAHGGDVLLAEVANGKTRIVVRLPLEKM